MCLDEYFIETLVRQRHAEAEAFAARQAIVRSLRTPWRVTVGRALVRVGRRLAAGAPARVQPSLS